ncbi:MAG: hypothetical protein LBK53_06725 [Heliobacteriaceae bacterium]|jgi:hypothetical protein|nr:hypothetical protein [Heliobacteriaceae bacterium]
MLSTPVNQIKTGTCPHGLPPGACPMCSGMGGGGVKKADFSAKAGEMSWNECAAIGAFLKAQQDAKIQKQQDLQNMAQAALSFQAALSNAGQKIANITQIISNTFPPVIAKPVNFVLNMFGKAVNLIQNIASFQPLNFSGKLADISDKLAAVMGELKAAIEDKISKTLSDLKKRAKRLFAIFGTFDAENEDKEIEESKRTFEIKTFIHDLYRKLTEGNNEH